MENSLRVETSDKGVGSGGKNGADHTVEKKEGALVLGYQYAENRPLGLLSNILSYVGKGNGPDV
jgi:hypothetical protein